MLRRFFIFYIAFFIAHPLVAQESPKEIVRTKIKKIYHLSRPEKWWVVFHPFIAPKTYRLTQKAIDVASAMKKDSALDGDESGGQVDAFRHSYWMALLSQKIKPVKALKLGIAHEKGNKILFKKSKPEEGILPDSASTVMDLENNKIGIEIGKNNKELSDEKLQLLIKNDIIKGKMKVLLKNKNGIFLDCEKNIIDLKYYSGKWNIPKCLVNSNEIFRKESGKIY